MLKNGGRFMVTDALGMLQENAGFGHGFYFEDTRYLSEWDFRLNGTAPALLSSSTADGYTGRFLYGNRLLPSDEDEGAPTDAYALKPVKIPNPNDVILAQRLLLQRDVVITDAVRERIIVTNYSMKDVTVRLSISFAADYADMFEVRGLKRKSRGAEYFPQIDQAKHQVMLCYKGLDNEWMSTTITFAGEAPQKLTVNQAAFELAIPPHVSKLIECSIANGRNKGSSPIPTIVPMSSFQKERDRVDKEYTSWRQGIATIRSDNASFDKLVERGLRDIYLLRQDTPRGLCIAAGVPWFAAAFGRDQGVTGAELLPFAPRLAREALLNLAAYQGKVNDEKTAEAPGKIMHELRLGEMARCKEIAFTPYYGSVDSTPLWLNLFCDYWNWTADKPLTSMLASNVKAALDYIDHACTVNGYLTYTYKPNLPLTNEGWKDSEDSIMYKDGAMVKSPVAVCEPQGYLYSAWSKIQNNESLFDASVRAKVKESAESLKTRFRKDFWIEDKQFAALALDGDKKQCAVVASNGGQLLGTGILSAEQEKAVADHLMRKDMFCGWGIRTLSADEVAYNPMSYHNGSVWPHDNAIIIQGLSRVGRTADGLAVTAGLFSAAQTERDMRLPELFCGFSSTHFGKPVEYPVSCVPQAWSAGSIFGMLQGCLGFRPDALHNQLTLVHPTLPTFLNRLTLQNVPVGKSRVTIELTRQNGRVACKFTSIKGNLKTKIE
jgi:glycogen debranching enzyme